MKIKPTFIQNLMLLERHVHQDERGVFNRLLASDELQAETGEMFDIIHINSSTSSTTGTMRGIHFQFPPFAEKKIVSCVSGSVWDVGIDLRPDSPTRFQWYGTLLTPSNGMSLIIPEGFGHAFITLEPNSTVVYLVNSIYSPNHECGILYNDPLLNINWPIQPTVISEKDRSWGKIEKRFKELDSGFSQIN